MLKAATGRIEDLQQLATRFRSGVHKDPGVLELDLDDLLVNLRELGHWPSQDVEWQPELADIVKDSHLDMLAAERQLQEEPSTVQPVSPNELLKQLDPGWQGPLTSFQIRDISKLLSLRHGANFSVPGAGKTRVALAIFHALRVRGEVRRLLVVGPKAAFETWQHENRTCLATPMRVQTIDGRRVDPLANLILINYERLPDNLTALARWVSTEPSMLILDEAHRMKRGSSGVHGSACLALGPRARRRLILTGTPAPNGVKDLENLFSFVWPGQGRQTVTRAVAGGDLRYASNALRPLFSRTTKKELNLPPVVTRIHRVALPSLHREIYSALTGEMSVRASKSDGGLEALGRIMIYLLMAATSPALLAVGTTRYEPLPYRVPPLGVPESAALSQLMRDLPIYEMSPKYQETMAIVAANAREGRKTLVWSTFVRSLTTLEQMLRVFQPAVVHGGTIDRDEQITRFREDPDCLVLLSNPATLGEGISLHKVCHDAVYVDRDFAAGRYLQSLDRIHRLGLDPDTTTNVTIVAADETIDDVVEERLAVKLHFMGTILDDPAVEQLADLDEEPSVGAGMDHTDLQLMLGHIHAKPST